MIKGPVLLCFDFKAETVRRYVRRKDWETPGLRWVLGFTHSAKISGKVGFDPAAVECFRVTGA